MVVFGEPKGEPSPTTNPGLRIHGVASHEPNRPFRTRHEKVG